MSKSKGLAAVDVNEPVTASFSFREKGKVQPQGYKGLGIDDDVTVTVKGKVKQIGSPWRDGAQFAIEIASCEITVPAASAVSLDSAIAGANSSRKKVK